MTEPSKRRRAGYAGRARPGAFSPWKARQAYGGAESTALVRGYPARTYAEDESRALRGVDDLGFPVVAAHPLVDERQSAVLRFLGRCYIADAAILHRLLYYPRFDLRTVYSDIQRLERQRLVWDAVVPSLGTKKINNGSTGRPRKVIGLSRAGKQLLRELDVEPDRVTLDQLIARDTRGRVPKPSSLSHDLQVTSWCASVIEGLRLVPWTTSIYFLSEFRSASTQRADALIVARFNFSRHREQLGAIPWFDGSPLGDEEVEVRWALELDNSTESLSILIDKFATYRDLHRQGVYHHLVNGPVILVLVVQDERRAERLAAAFADVWPEGWGLVSTPSREGVYARSFGALWGRYYSMTTEAEVPLLSILERDAVSGRRQYVPLLTHDLWLRYVARSQAGRACEALEDLGEL